MNFTLSVQNANGEIKSTAISQNGEPLNLVHPGGYKRGDQITLSCSEPGYFYVRLEDTMPFSLIYLSQKEFTFPIPFGRLKQSYCPRSFKGRRHLISARFVAPSLLPPFRNLALNPYDHESSTALPHASANAQTRAEAMFAPRNAIDGITASSHHGFYPFGSWGIAKNPNAALTVFFARPSDISALDITLRADFPHDNYWKQVSIVFSDESTQTISLEKTGNPQHISISRKNITWLRMEKLIPSEDPSPFPALTQIAVWGQDSQTF